MSPTQFPRHLKPIEPQGSYLLEQERKRASFDPKDITVTLYGQDYLQKRERILKIIENDPILGDKSHRYYTGRDVRFKKALAAAKRLVELTRYARGYSISDMGWHGQCRIHHWTPEEFAIADFLFDESTPVSTLLLEQ